MTQPAVVIERHPLPAQEPDGVQAELEAILDSLHRYPGDLPLAFGIAQSVLAARLVGDPRGGGLESWQACVTAMQLGHALFDVASAAGPGGDRRPVTHLIAGREITLRADEPLAFGPSQWVEALWYAVICRENDRIAALCAVSEETLRSGGADPDAYVWEWVGTLKILFQGGPGLIPKLTATMKATEPELLREATRWRALRVDYPPIDLLHRMLRGDADRFNETLGWALETHREHWTDTSEDAGRPSSPRGSFALGLLAVACLARGSDIPVTVESGYLTHYFLQATWYGEFPTSIRR
ncbi:hypothetical protein GCM10022221_53320 [Actinocorallia aurea]